MKVSVLILTLNEEINILNCINSVDWCSDVVVLDSYSTDRTEEIAVNANARVYKREFDNYSAQRSYGINEIEYTNKWLLMLDADEIVPAELKNEILALDDNCNFCLFRVKFKNMFLGRWMKRSAIYPTWAGRLIKIGHVSVEREINEEYHTDGNVGLLKEHIIHYSYNKGFHSWFEKHNNYSTAEAAVLSNKEPQNVYLKCLLSKDPAFRRKALKAIFYKLPFRPFLIFIYLYLFRRGILEGRAGFLYSLLRAHYEFMINCKIKEIKRRRNNLPI